MKFTKILALILAVLMMASLFAACKEEPTPTPDPNTQEQPDDPSAKKGRPLELVTQGVANYVIVRDYKAGGAVLDAVNNIVKAIKEFTGAEVEIKECYNDREEEIDVVTEKEILVGMTNRPESAEAFKGKRSGDWTLSVSGNKLIVGGTSDRATTQAASRFLSEFIYEQGNKYDVKNYFETEGKKGTLHSLVFYEGDNIAEKGTYSYDLFEIFGARIDSFAIIHAKNDARADLCSTYAEKLCEYISKEAGFQLVNKKDTRCYADYEILIGNTIRTKEGIAENLGENDYYIELEKTEKGAKLYILFGEKAQDKAYDAFRKEIMPARKTPDQKSITGGFIYTNNDALR